MSVCVANSLRTTVSRTISVDPFLSIRTCNHERSLVVLERVHTTSWSHKSHKLVKQ